MIVRTFVYAFRNVIQETFGHTQKRPRLRISRGRVGWYYIDALWIDDERPRPNEYTHHAKTSSDAITLLTAARLASVNVSKISFDHDLSIVEGDDDTSRPVMRWIIEHDSWPDEMAFHTANPVGHEWLVGMATRYAPPTTWVDPRDLYA